MAMGWCPFLFCFGGGSLNPPGLLGSREGRKSKFHCGRSAPIAFETLGEKKVLLSLAALLPIWIPSGAWIRLRSSGSSRAASRRRLRELGLAGLKKNNDHLAKALFGLVSKL